MSSHTLLVTGIGGNVGQGVVRVIRDLLPDAQIIGTNTRHISGGSHLCDEVLEVPQGNTEDYLEIMATIGTAHGVELIFPCTDLETAVLSAAGSRVAATVCSPPETCRAFHDKFETSRVLSRAGVAFAESFLPSEYEGQFEGTVVKPRTGRGSRDVHRDPPNPTEFDDSFVVQRRYVGTEITVAFYVLQTGEMHGLLALQRELSLDGTTVFCETTHRYDDALAEVIAGMTAALPIRGPCNLQVIADEHGDIHPFEVNCRFSGTTSIRHHFGYRDVEWALQEHLEGRRPSEMVLRAGAAARVLMDVIYPDTGLAGIKNRRTPHILF